MGGADRTGVFPVSASLQAYRSGEPGNGSKFRETATVCRIAVQMPAAAGPRPIKPAAVLAPVKAKPKRVAAKTRPALTGPARDGCENCGRDGLPTFLQVLFCAPFQIFFRGWSSGSLFDVGAADCAQARGVLGRIFADGILPPWVNRGPPARAPLRQLSGHAAVRAGPPC